MLKANARKVRLLGDGKVIAGFAGATADAFALFERLEGKLEQYKGAAGAGLRRDGEGLAHGPLPAPAGGDDGGRRPDVSLVLTGNGDVLEPEDGLIGIGSGGAFALAAARALYPIEGIDAEAVARRAMEIAAGICIYTNETLTIESLETP